MARVRFKLNSSSDAETHADPEKNQHDVSEDVLQQKAKENDVLTENETKINKEHTPLIFGFRNKG